MVWGGVGVSRGVGYEGGFCGEGRWGRGLTVVPFVLFGDEVEKGVFFCGEALAVGVEDFERLGGLDEGDWEDEGGGWEMCVGWYCCVGVGGGSFVERK